MIKFTAIVFCVLAGFCVAVNGDTIVLKNAGKDVELKVKGVTGEYIIAAISKKSLRSLNMQFSSPGNYPDTISLDIANVAVECKVKEITDDAIHVLIPTSKISTLHMSFQSDDKQGALSDALGTGSGQKVTDAADEKEKSGQVVAEGVPEPKIQDDAAREIMVDEIRTGSSEKKEEGKSFRLKTKKKKKEKLPKADEAKESPSLVPESGEGESPLSGDAETPAPDQELVTETQAEKQETDKAGEELKKEDPVAQDKTLGTVEGKILRSGSPLPECQVKLQMLEKGGLLAKGYHPVEDAMEIEAVTDGSGVYRFVNVSPGLYKLYWKPPAETTWVRRFKMEPDVVVESGKLTNPKDIETIKRTLN